MKNISYFNVKGFSETLKQLIFFIMQGKFIPYIYIQFTLLSSTQPS